MKITKICPICGIPSFEVNAEIVKHFSKEKIIDSKWGTCVNPQCKVGYFCKNQILYTNDLNRMLWYKTKSKKSYICYCSKLSRNDIAKAVEQGAKNFGEVQKITQKNRTGFCEKENPLGQCCKEVFIYEVEKAKKHLTSKSSGFCLRQNR